MLFIGIDSGSTVTKLAAVAGGVIIHTGSAPSGTDPVRSGTGLLESALRETGTPVGESRIIVTGYGRKLLSNLGDQKTEITCHAAGAHALLNGRLVPGPAADPGPALQELLEFTLLDIGGQDSKAIKVDSTGRAADFAMNDKCAAGTGRFLEVISRTLGYGMDGLSAAAVSSGRRARLSSMCTVFADSEVVSLTARGENPAEIAWAACYAVAERCAGLVKRIGLKAGNRVRPVLVFTGGVSGIGAVAEALGEITGAEIMVPPMARFSGAVGAALLAGG
jgi:predicted CoA-substrate-specific enzyme activase